MPLPVRKLDDRVERAAKAAYEHMIGVALVAGLDLHPPATGRWEDEDEMVKDEWRAGQRQALAVADAS
jgi:hypothetical protein